jgi:Ion channel
MSRANRSPASPCRTPNAARCTAFFNPPKVTLGRCRPPWLTAIVYVHRRKPRRNLHGAEEVTPRGGSRSAPFRELWRCWNRSRWLSLRTITSVGYGDIVPVSTAARALTVLEAPAGQIYLVALVARLVGTHTAQHMKRRSNAFPDGL